METAKYTKYLPLAALVGIYQVYARKAPADPFGQLQADIQGYTFAKLKTKVKEILTALAIIILLPLILKEIRLPAPIKLIVTALAWYLVGDQIGKAIDDPYYSNQQADRKVIDARPRQDWGTGSSAVSRVSAPSGIIRNTYGGM